MLGRILARKRRGSRVLVLLSVAGIALGCGLTQAVDVASAAATITVTTTNDSTATDGQCSLREAITNANANADTTGGDCVAGTGGADTIDVSSVIGVITLGSNLPTITDDLTVGGSDPANLTIDSNGNAHVFTVGGVAFTIVGLTLTGGAGASSGGGIDSEFGTVTVEASTVTGNASLYGGGGIYNYGGSLTVYASTISNNSTSGFGSGGGIFTSNGGTMTVVRSTISGNSAGFGGGIGLDGLSSTILNSTIADNSASGTGGGILDELGVLTVISTTITANSSPNPGFGSAGGIQMAFGGTSATLQNTIVAGQTAGLNCNQPPGAISDAGYNIEDSTTCGFSSANQSQPATNPMLDAGGLKDNGGSTQTIALLQGSPAIDAIPGGTNGCGTTITADQRNVTRPQGAGCELGAFELLSAPLLVRGAGVVLQQRMPVGMFAVDQSYDSVTAKGWMSFALPVTYQGKHAYLTASSISPRSAYVDCKAGKPVSATFSGDGSFVLRSLRGSLLLRGTGYIKASVDEGHSGRLYGYVAPTGPPFMPEIFFPDSTFVGHLDISNAYCPT